jgi:F-box/TPR repeat protein Pof3
MVSEDCEWARYGLGLALVSRAPAFVLMLRKTVAERAMSKESRSVCDAREWTERGRGVSHSGLFVFLPRHSESQRDTDNTMSGTLSWKKHLTEGMKSFRKQDFDSALTALDEVGIQSCVLAQTHLFSQAIRLANNESYVLYDSRASVYERLSCFNLALDDASQTIEIGPAHWQGYFRSARLLASLGRSEAALQMCSSALWRLGGSPKEVSCRQELSELRRHLEAQPKCFISRLPVELLLVVFKISNNPSVIVHVCHHWREVAHSQPPLWRNLVLSAPPESALSKITEWHKQSCGWITELHICKSLGVALFPSGVNILASPPETSSMYADIVVALQQLDLTRIQQCHMQDIAMDVLLPALDEGTGFVNSLKALSSWCKPPHYEVARFGCDKLSWQNLCSLSLTSVACDWEELSAALNSLTSFEYKIHKDVCYFGGFHQFLLANPGLEKLVIETVMSFDEINYPYFPPIPLEPLTLAHLHHLELKGIAPFHIKAGNFSLPSLHILRIPFLKDASLELSSLIEDKGTSFAELIELTTQGRLIGRQNLSAILLQAPKLKVLSCTDFDNTVAETLSKPCTAFLRDLEDPSRHIPIQLPVLCPALTVLDFSWSSRLKVDPGVQPVKERVNLAASDGGRYQLPGTDADCRVACIQTLRVDGCPHIEEEKLPWFQENVPEFTCRYDLKRKG